MRALQLVLGLGLLVLPGIAHAHFNLIAPPPSTNSTDGGKGLPPCGPDTPSAIVTPAQGGHPLVLQLNETVFHPGFYRVALSIDSRTELPVDNVVKDAMGKVLSPTGPGNSDSAEYETTAVFPVLADHLFAHTTRPTTTPSFETSLTLPNVTCEKCTLQVIEFMAQHGPNPGGGYFYHHCADLKITADPSLPPFAGAGGSGAGGSGGGGGSGGASAGASGSAGANPSGGIAGVSGSAGSDAAGGGGASGSATAGMPAIAGASASAGAGAAGASAGGASAGATSVAGANAAGTTGSAADGADSGGCSLDRRAARTQPFFWALALGLLGFGRRRTRRA